MIAGVLDIVAFTGFTAAAAISIVAILRAPDRRMVVPMLCALGAAIVMVVVSAGNALNGLGITSAMHSIEEYWEIIFVPLVVYMAYSLHRVVLSARVERERDIAAKLHTRLESSLEEIGEQRLGMLQALSAAVDARDHYTALHSMHVADYACAVAYHMGVRDEVQTIEQAGLLHDIGKIGVPDTILLKPDRLTEEEYDAIKRHVTESAHIISGVPFLAEVVPMVRHHHERWDGGGYPDSLDGARIPSAARVLAVADAFDAMTTDRPYRAALPTGAARSALLDGRGSQFDPDVVDAFVELLDSGVIVVGARAAG